ncbi:MAG: peptidylprolyl isomerase [Clostridia bacterium]|nr:peptidylprolyl isomerase [Clostridia bacterium]
MLSACTNTANTTSTKETPAPSPSQTTEAVEQTENSELYADTIGFTIELENGGIMKGELYPNLAPITVENFVDLCDDNFYDGLIFHRVIKGFMIQGGGYDKDMQPKETDSIKGEFDANGVNNPLKHTKGVLSMARTQVPDSASSQFFIMHEDAPHLDGQYAAFGRVTEGFDIIDEIATSETTIYQPYGMTDVPKEQIVIKTITIDD